MKTGRGSTGQRKRRLQTWRTEDSPSAWSHRGRAWLSSCPASPGRQWKDGDSGRREMDEGRASGRSCKLTEDSPHPFQKNHRLWITLKELVSWTESKIDSDISREMHILKMFFPPSHLLYSLTMYTQEEWIEKLHQCNGRKLFFSSSLVLHRGPSAHRWERFSPSARRSL